MAKTGAGFITLIVEFLHDVGIRRRVDQAVADLTGSTRHFRAAGRYHDRCRLIGEGEEAGVFHGVKITPEIGRFPGPQLVHYFNRFDQHRFTDGKGRPMVAKNMFVKIFAGAYSQEEAPRHHRRRSGRRLGNNGGMNAHRRAGDTGAKPQLLCDLGNAADHAPDKRAVALCTDPGMVMIRNERKRKTHLFCTLGMTH